MFRILLIPVWLCCACCSALSAEERFADGWHQSVKLTDVNSDGRASICNAWVDDGWLIVERCDVSGDIEWQIVLAQAGEQDDPPTIEPNPHALVLGGLRVSYRGGLFFIRDDKGSLRCLRQKKSADAKWPALVIPQNEPEPGGAKMGAPGGRMRYARINHDWQFIAGGLDDEQAEYVLRMKHPEVEEISSVLSASNGGDVIRMWVTGPFEPGGHFSQYASLIDDGDLLVVQRVREVDVERARAARLHREKMEAGRRPLLDAPPPEISATKWLNSPPIAWKELHGKTVLLYYEQALFAQAADQLSKLQQLYEEYRDQGFTVIALLPSGRAGWAAEAIKSKGLTFPIAIDDGQTCERFCITDSPSYFLINRDGKIVSSQYADRFGQIAIRIPRAADIEPLVKGGK